MSKRLAPAARGLVYLLLLAPVATGSPARADTTRSDLRTTPLSERRLSLKALDGGRVSLEVGWGRVVLVHFFATWCEPCRPELASLDRLQAETKDLGLDVLAISVAKPEARLQRFFADNPVRFTIALDPDRAASRAWEIEALPSTVVVDRSGRTRLQVRGDLDWQRADVRGALDELLAGSGQPNQDIPGGRAAR